jgi:putative addiction module component (TIGR02574 family)
MSLSAEKVAEALGMPVADRAFLAHELIASLEEERDLNPAEEWNEELDRRTREIEIGSVQLISHEQVVAELRAKLNAHQHAS